ncbi:MAG: hypothetical protein ACI32F_01100 [Allobaculum sp.]
MDQATHFPLLKEIRAHFKKADRRNRLAQASDVQQLANLLFSANDD